MNKKTLSIIAIIFLCLLSIMPLIGNASATDTQFGDTSIYTGSGANFNSANTLVGRTFPSSTLDSGDWVVSAGHAALCPSSSGGGSVKMLIIDDDKHIIATSNAVVVTSTYFNPIMHNFTFTGSFHLDKAESDNYTLALISSGKFSWGTANGGSNAGYLADTSNSYTSPSDPTDASFSTSYLYGISLDVTSGGGPTPTPPPTASGDFWDTGVGAQIFGFLPTLTSLIVVLMAAFLGWKYAGPWGFFAGLNIGYVVSVMFGILPLWGFIALLVVDGLLLFGKVGFHN